MGFDWIVLREVGRLGIEGEEMGSWRVVSLSLAPCCLPLEAEDGQLLVSWAAEATWDPGGGGRHWPSSPKVSHPANFHSPPPSNFTEGERSTPLA